MDFPCRVHAHPDVVALGNPLNFSAFLTSFIQYLSNIPVKTFCDFSRHITPKLNTTSFTLCHVTLCHVTSYPTGIGKGHSVLVRWREVGDSILGI